MYEALSSLDSVHLNFSPSSLFILNITLAIIMVGVALGIKLKGFKDLLLHPKPFIVGVISQFILLPAFTFLLVISLKLPESVALGMILVASCPGGNISNFMSSLAKGNVELSVSLTMFSTLAAVLLTPFNFAMWGGLFLKFAAKHYGELAPITINFWEMFKAVVIILLIPLTIGLFISHKWPNAAKKAGPYVRIVSIFIFLAMVVIMILNNWEFVVNYVQVVFLLVFLHNAIALLTGYYWSKLNKLPHYDAKTISIETGIQNSGLALVLIFNPKLFNGLGGMAAIAAWWGVWHIISGLTMGFIWGYIHKPKTVKNVELQESTAQ